MKSTPDFRRDLGLMAEDSMDQLFSPNPAENNPFWKPRRSQERKPTSLSGNKDIQ